MAVFRLIPAQVRSGRRNGALSPQIQGLAHLTKGLVLVTGPTGSGKSTTLAALIDLVNATRNEHILTIEDPIEFVHKGRSA
jgi:twitching motility protein PilT